MLERTYREDGFVVLPRFCDDAELAALEAVVADLVRDRTGGDDRLPRLLWVRLSAEERDRLAPGILARAREVAARCLGVASVEVEARLFVKPPHVGAPVPWHQDEAYNDPWIDQPQANVWIPLDAVDEQTGCLRVVPGSHRAGRVTHRRAAQPLTLEVDGPAPPGAVALPLRRGDASIHDRGLLHSSGANAGEQRRTAVVLTCRGPARRRSAPLDAPWLADLLGSVPRSNLAGGGG
jgi:hypothetical protein